ncbi:MAG: hypothetical protein AAF989_05520 [Planctomycetota bacterium]
MTTVLILVPTPMERDELSLRWISKSSEVQIDVCGFGLVAAAARTSQLIARHEPKHVVLLGIAGQLGGGDHVGKVMAFRRVGVLGLGVGAEQFDEPARATSESVGKDDSASLRSPSEMGWEQFQDIGDELTLDATVGVDDAIQGDLLLSVCAASATPGQASARATRYPAADAEDMEAFAVAFISKLAGVRFSVFRGISNRAGDRNHSRWCIESAMDRVVEVLPNVLAAAGVRR